MTDAAATNKEAEQQPAPKAVLPPRGKGDAAKFLAFALGSEEYAAPLLTVREVLAFTEVTPVPYTPPHFLGIMNLRGQVISVIDMRLKFRMPKTVLTAETAIIIFELDALCLGVVVDAVNSVLAVSQADISPPPETEAGINADFITGVIRRDKRLTLLLDISRTLSVEDLRTIKQGPRATSAA